jgi:predicted nucleic acid-binding protein
MSQGVGSQGAGNQAAGWLIDTNVVAELRMGSRADPAVRAWAEAVPPVACYLSRASIAELHFAIQRVTDPGFRAELEAWLRDGLLPWFADRIVEVDERVLVRWRQLVWDGRRENYTFAQPDALLAAMALERGLGVVTGNTLDFERAGLTLLNPWRYGA